MALPLLKFPALVILQILGLTSFIELFLLSHTSKIMGRIIRNHAKIRGHVWELSIGEDVSMDLISLKTKLPVSSIVLRPSRKLESSPFTSSYNLKFGKSSAIPCILMDLGFGFASVELYSNDTPVVKKIYDQIRYIFPLPLVKAELNLSGARDNYKWAVKWLNTFNLSEIKISGNLCDFSHYIGTIRAIRPSGNVIVSARPTSFDRREAGNVNLKNFTFQNAEWIRSLEIKQSKLYWNLEGAFQ